MIVDIMNASASTAEVGETMIEKEESRHSS
jgi:hypothetical protein